MAHAPPWTQWRFVPKQIALLHTVFRIRIHFLQIRIQDFFPNPDPDLGSGSRQQKTNFSKAQKNFWENFLLSTQKVGILFLFLTNQVSILLNIELLFGR